MASLIVQAISHHEILELLSGGGLGVVHKAPELHRDRLVALRFQSPGLPRAPDAETRFIHEAGPASALRHDNIYAIHDIDDSPGSLLLICRDFYGGDTLRRSVDRGPLPVEEVMDSAIRVARGLARARGGGDGPLRRRARGSKGEVSHGGFQREAW